MDGGTNGAEREVETADVRFAADATVGRLAKWLRLLGYDTTFHRGRADSAFLLTAGRERRVVLTRVRELAARQYQGRLLVIRSDKPDEQVAGVLAALELAVDPERFFRLCLRCNEPLTAIARSEVEGRVPVYVFENQTAFRICSGCGRIYWPGTHGEHARSGLIGRILSRRP
jgi:uncharacterized protein with PIN domain